MINLRQNKGFALTFTLIFLFLIVSFMAVYILAVAEVFSEANRTANLKKAYYVADAGLLDAYQRITQAGITTFAASNSFIPSSTTDNGVYSVGSTNGSYTVVLAVTTNPLTYTITSTGTYAKQSKTLQLIMTAATLAKYAYWTNTETNPALGDVWWITGMLTVGAVQTNTSFYIYGNPVFDGPVSEGGAAPDYYDGTATNANGEASDPSYVFSDGLTNNAPLVSVPSQQTLSAIQAIASNGSGLVLTGASTIIFNPTGTVTITGNVINSSCTTTTKYKNTTVSKPSNGVIYVQSTDTIANCHSTAQDGNATVQGTVSGQLTVAADQNVYVSGNVAYNSDPRTTPTSTDMLGLVASENVTVIEADAPSQLEIVGVLMALQGSFNVDQYTVNKDPIDGGSVDGAVMDQFGSLINDYRGPIGTFNPTSGNLVSGWSEDQSYDTRLLTTAPPGFPPYVNASGDAVYNKVSITECISGVCG